MIYTKLTVTTMDAILSLNPNAKVAVTTEEDGTYTVDWGETAVISNSNIDAELARLKTEWANHEYQRKRKVKYNALNQFELISEDAINGTTTHKDAIAAIKAEFPKP